MMSEDYEQQISRPISPSFHVIFLHQKIGNKPEDRYIVDAGMALRQFGHKVTIITCQWFDKTNCFDEIKPITGEIDVRYSGWWIPNCFFGFFKDTAVTVKSAWMAIRTALFPPSPRPKVIFLDTDTIALLFLRCLTRYKTMYIQHFPKLRECDVYYSTLRHTPNLLTAKTIGWAHDIIVENHCMARLLRKSFSKLKNGVKVLYPSFDAGIWSETGTDVYRIIPDLPKRPLLFVVFGEYKPRSNFKLALDALEILLMYTEEEFRGNVHMVIAGHCSENSLQQIMYYEEVLSMVKNKPCGSQVTFLRQLPAVHMITLLLKCTAVIHPTKNDYYPGPIILAMKFGKAIIATNSGFAADVLDHRISGFLLEPVAKTFAVAMYKLLTIPTLKAFVGDMAKDRFMEMFCFDTFARTINKWVLKICGVDYLGEID